MKNSAEYARKIKPLLAAAKGKAAPAAPADLMQLMIQAILEEDASPKAATAALGALHEEFIDYNELRVSPHKDIVECIGEDYPAARAKAECVTRALNAVFEHTNTLSLDYLSKRPKREIRKALREELGLSPYAEAVLTLVGFAGHALPVDALLLESLKADGAIHPDSDIPDLQGFLERIVPGKDAAATYPALREYAVKNARRVAAAVARHHAQAMPLETARSVEGPATPAGVGAAEGPDLDVEESAPAGEPAAPARPPKAPKVAKPRKSAAARGATKPPAKPSKGKAAPSAPPRARRRGRK